MNKPTIYILTCTAADKKYSITLIDKKTVSAYASTLREAADLRTILIVDGFTGEVHYRYEDKVVKWDDGEIN